MAKLKTSRFFVLILLVFTFCNYPATRDSHAATINSSPTTDTPYLDQSLTFQRISLEHGLSQSTVNCIFQDRQGYMWFGTSDGLNRYDGYSFTLYEHQLDDPFSLSDDSIYSIYQGRDGALWFGTQNGLNRFDPETERFTSFQAIPGDAKSLSHNLVQAVYEDQAGTLWVGTVDGLDWLDRDEGLVSHFESEVLGQHYAVWVIYGDQAGAVWVGTDRGLLKFDQHRTAVAYYKSESARGSLSNDSVRSIYQDQAGTLWFGTDHGLHKFDDESETFVSFRSDPKALNSLGSDGVLAIHGDQAGALWLGTVDGGLDRFDPETGRFAHFRHDFRDPYSLSSDSVRSVYVDREGLLWVGTFVGGVNKADIDRRVAHYKNDPQNSNSLVHNTVWAFYEDRAGTLWIGTANGVDRLYRDTGQFVHFWHDPKNEHSLSDNYVRAIYQDQAGNMWFGTRSGLDKMDLRTRRFTHYRQDSQSSPSLSNSDISDIIQDRAGVFWIGTRGGGVNRFEPDKGSIEVYWNWPDEPNGLSNNFIKQIYEDQAGMLWIGSYGGLDRLDPQTETVVSFRHDPADPHSLSNDLVQSIHQDQAGTLWVGTYQGGLNKFDPATGSFVHYGKSDGLPNDAVYGILEDSVGYLWLSTNQGLSRFDPRTAEFVNYDARDGLQSNEFNGGASYQNSSGEMFFGGINGFNVFYPELMGVNSYVPPLVLTNLTQGGEPVDVGQAGDGLAQVTFRWPNNFFEFEFAALSYAQPEKNQYAYKLVGFDEQWNESGARNFGRYTNLPSGAYTLRIIGSNNSGVWNEQGVSVRIVIAPPFWGTWWFQGAAVLLLVGVAIGAYRWRVRSIQARSRELEAEVQQRTAELRQEIAQRAQAEEALRQSEMDKAVTAERNRLARELHDAVTQTLFSASLIAEVLPRMWQADPEQGRQQLEEVRLLTRGALAEMRALLIELRPGALAQANMRDLLGQLGRAMTGRTGVPVRVVAQGDGSVPPAVQLAFYRIAQEALNNVAKHADATQVEVEFQWEAGRVRLAIGDDGQGFVPVQGDLDVAGVSAGHFGLGIMRERAATIDADLRLDSRVGEGTRVVVEWRGENADRRNWRIKE